MTKAYADGLIDAMTIVAEASCPVKVSEFTDATWKMLCSINVKLAAKAAEAFADGEEPRR